MSAHLSLVRDDHAWWHMASAPKDGTVIRVMVHGPEEEGHAHRLHEFPYDVRWHEGRWCFAVHNGPLFPWQVPQKWRPA